MAARQAPRRSAWFTIHRWLGIALGTWFALVGLTGSLLVYDEAIDAWLNPQLLRARSAGAGLPALLPADAIVERAADLGFGAVERIRFPLVPGEVYRLQLRATQRRVGAERIEALFDPGSGALLGTRGADSLGLAPPLLMRTLYEFHRNVLLGPTGSNIVGIAGLLLLASSVTGIVLGWPRKRAAWRRLVWINRRANATRQVFDLHRSAGALFAVLLLLATLTGATLVYLNYVRDLVNVVSPVKSFPTVPWRAAPLDAERSLPDAIARVRAAFPQHALVELRTPTGQLDRLRVLPQAAGRRAPPGRHDPLGPSGERRDPRRTQRPHAHRRRNLHALALPLAQRFGLRHTGPRRDVPDGLAALAARQHGAVGVVAQAARRADRTRTPRARAHGGIGARALGWPGARMAERVTPRATGPSTAGQPAGTAGHRLLSPPGRPGAPLRVHVHAPCATPTNRMHCFRTRAKHHRGLPARATAC